MHDLGHLLTSSNYNDDEKKVTGGRNGFGAKLTNIFSKKFSIEVADTKRQKLYRQEFSNNLSLVGSPNISKYDGDYDYTEVTFEPDLKKFGMKTLDD
jgi:DNA topoisomerase-2